MEEQLDRYDFYPTDMLDNSYDLPLYEENKKDDE